jgi:Putative beta barrel porin-7 (BBP7)
MRSLWKSSLALSLGLIAARASAADPAPPAVSIGRPVAASIGRPVPVPVLDPGIQPTSFDGDGRIIRAKAPDVIVDRPVATTQPALNGPNQAMFTWRRPDETAPQPLPAGPSSDGPIVSPPMAAPVAPSGPIVTDPCVDGSVCGTGHTRGLLVGCKGGLFGFGICDGSWLSCFESSTCPKEFCDACYPGNRVYVKAEYLLWATRGQPTPELLTTSLPPGGGGILGSLDDPNRTVLFGGREIGSEMRSGGRFQAGYWFTDDHLLGIDASFFFLGDRNTSVTFASDANGNPPLFRPFTNVASGTPVQDSEIVSFPNALSGTFTAQTHSRFWGGDANLRTNLCCGPNYFFDPIIGFRYVTLEEGLSLTETPTAIANIAIGNQVITRGTQFLVNDTFNTSNRFYGGQVGFTSEVRSGCWSLGLDTKIGLGVTEQSVDIRGTSIISIPGQTPAVFNSGMLTQDTNIGHHRRDVFTVLPEIGLTLGYQLTDHCRLSLGYNFLYWSDVARPGNQIDFTTNSSKFPRTNQAAPTGDLTRPAFNFSGSEFWAQGLTAGLEFRW